MKRLILVQLKKIFIFRLLLKKLNRLDKPKFTYPISKQKFGLNGQIAYNMYGGYFVPISSQHRPAAQKILKGDIYEPNTIEFIRKNCSDGDIIHAGTYFGDFLPGISKKTSKNFKIWAFEPNVENYKCAQITILINDLDNIQLFNAGLGSSTSKVKMRVKKKDGTSLGGSSFVIDTKSNDGTIDIDIVRIDDVIPAQSNISIIQLDIEGYEKNALKGALETIKRCKPILILEDNNNIISSDWFKKNILEIGYKIDSNIHNNTVLVANI